VAYQKAARTARRTCRIAAWKPSSSILKPGAPASPPITLDPVKLRSQVSPVPLENDRVRVLRTVLEPRVKKPAARAPRTMWSCISRSCIRPWTMADGRVGGQPAAARRVAWRDALNMRPRTSVLVPAVEIQWR